MQYEAIKNKFSVQNSIFTNEHGIFMTDRNHFCLKQAPV